MKVLSKNFFILFFLLLGLTACQQENLSDPVKGGFSVSLKETAAEVETKAASEGLDKSITDKFKLLITNQETGKELYNGSYTDETIPASLGTYTVKATCSPNTSYNENPLLSLDAPYYVGTAEAILKAKETVPVSIVCKLANALASIRFGSNKDKFEDLFLDYGVEVKVGKTSVVLQDSLHCAYYRAGSDVKFFFNGTLKGNNQEVSQELTHSEFNKAETFIAGSHCVINLSVEKTTSGVILTVAAAEVKKETINATIPMEWLPTPKILAKGFIGNTLDLYETASPKDVSFDFDLSSSLQELKFTVNFEDQVYKALNGDYTLSTMSDADKAKFVDAGIILPVIGQSSPSINITELTSNLKAENEQTINNIFSITEVKANNRTVSGEYKILTHKPEFSVNVLPGNIWTKEFTAEDCTVTEGKGDATAINADLIYQYSADNGRTWNEFNDNTNARQAFISTPENKIYQVRALYRGELASSAINVELESPIQLPNSDMEEWTSSTRYEQPYYQPWSEHVEHCWDTNNNETMRDKYSTYPNYKTFPTTTYTEDGYKGRAAVIRTVAANNGWASEVMSGTAYRGKLIVGNTDDSGNITEGYSFGSRPTELDFYYKYDSYNNERFGVYVELMNGDDVIASNSYISGRQTVSSYTLASVLLPYDESDLKPATSIRIRCYSVAEGEDPAVRKQTITIPAGSRKIYGGSCLTIDNISLIYDK